MEENLYKVKVPFTISQEWIKNMGGGSLPKKGQVLSYPAGVIIRIDSHHKKGKSGTTVYNLPILFQDGSSHFYPLTDADIYPVSKICIQSADGDNLECINPNAAVIDNDPGNESITLLGMKPILGYITIALGVSLLIGIIISVTIKSKK